MAVLADLNGISFQIHHNDHMPPHFHAYYAGGEAIVEIATLNIVRSNLPDHINNTIVQWATARRLDLSLAWVQARSNMAVI